MINNHLNISHHNYVLPHISIIPLYSNPHILSIHSSISTPINYYLISFSSISPILISSILIIYSSSQNSLLYVPQMFHNYYKANNQSILIMNINLLIYSKQEYLSIPIYNDFLIKMMLVIINNSYFSNNELHQILFNAN